MKKLSRPAAPECLGSLVGGRDDWNHAAKEDIWVLLDEMQQGFCAYCECHLRRKHIEHFRKRSRYPKLTFYWHNLFGSCGDSLKQGGWTRCGIYKDNGAGTYQVEKLIKPDAEDPGFYLSFLISGGVRPRQNLTHGDLLKATETIRVLNLNCDSILFNSRRQAINACYAEIEQFYTTQNDFCEEEWNALLQDELSRVKNEEFSTALTHAWRHPTNI